MHVLGYSVRAVFSKKETASIPNNGEAMIKNTVHRNDELFDIY